jgi:hypothetical protein
VHRHPDDRDGVRRLVGRGFRGGERRRERGFFVWFFLWLFVWFFVELLELLGRERRR